ncbi:protein-methionine sulfoxide oxidase mical3a-like [Seriola lalandi dorsalis]|uniref:protein-methionine sulfoxide oxidase mical3a-like n=1 Tax=Seriola lalandi dorsalis TaxID=1841481 RepID=UPI000C6F71E2|nr:protein-methionine sulfoxide oxidase mical3a-like [Seriola lalandi dorsalis]
MEIRTWIHTMEIHTWIHTIEDFADTEQLLSRGNVDQNALQAYAHEAANFSTNHQLPSLDFAMNHYGQPDVAMFDFTCMYASENAAIVRQRHGHQLLITLVGDSLLEPFWPMGTGVARGFLAGLDSAWMIRSWSQGAAPLDVLAERESLYRLLPQTTPENMQKNISLFSVDPTTRYVNINHLTITPAQVRHLVDTGEKAGLNTNCGDIIRLPSPRFPREESFSQSNQLLTWCQEQTRGYRGVAVDDLTTSWKSGLALCALIHRYRPDLIHFDSLDQSSVEENTRLGFDMAEREFGISPLMTVEEMWSVGEPDSLSMVMYLSQFYQLLKDSPPPAGSLCHSSDLRSALITPASLLSRLGHSPSRRKKPNEQIDAAGKRRKTSRPGQEQHESCDLNGDVESQMCDEVFVGGSSGSRVRLMANQLQAKLDESSSTCRSSSSSSSAVAALRRQCIQMYTVGVSSLAEQIANRSQPQEEVSSFAVSCSDVCFLCKKRVYVMERVSAEGLFFHRSCFQCDYCSSTLRLAAYAYDQHSGRFYCLQHFDCRLNATTVRKRPAPSDRAASHRTSIASLASAPSLSSTDSLISADHRRPSAVSVMAAMPERVELENYRRSSTKAEKELEEEPKEVSEETLNWFNLGVEQKHNRRSSSESEMEEEEGENRGGGRHRVTSEEARSSWKETLQLHLRNTQEEEGEEEDVQGEYSPWEMERRSGLWLLIEEETEEDLTPGVSQSPSPAEGSDITHSVTPVEPDSTSSLSSCITSSTPSSVTPPPCTTTSTASFIATPDSTHDEGRDTALPTHLTPAIVTETVAQRHVPRQPVAGGRGSFDDISPELPPKKPLLLQERGAGTDEEVAESEWMRRRKRHKGAHSLPPRLLLPPLQGGSGALLLQLKGLRETLPPGQVEVEGGGARALWRAVFSGNKREKRDVRGGLSLTEESELDSSTLLQRCSLTPRNNPAYVPHALAFKRSYAIKRRSVKDRVPLQDSDGQSSCPTEVVGVLVQPKEPSSLSVKETMFQRGQQDEDEDLDTKITRRVQRAARRQAKQEQLKRLHKAQVFAQGFSQGFSQMFSQRFSQMFSQMFSQVISQVISQGFSQMFSQMFSQGFSQGFSQRFSQMFSQMFSQVRVCECVSDDPETAAADYWGESNDSQDLDLHLGGLGRLDNPALMQQWFQLVQQKNSLVRYESELMIFARELELEDRQSRLQQELRERMAVEDHLKEDWQLVEERLILEEMLEVVEQRDSLVSLLEEQRLQERQEDQDLEEVMMTRGLGLSWS